MKKYILILLLFPFISNAQWSIQNYQFNVFNDGKVGIGTTTPTSKFEVVDGFNTYGGTPPLAIARTTTNDKIAFMGSAVTNLSELLPAYNIGIYGSANGGTNNFAGYFNLGNVYVKQNLGIGTKTPTSKLEIVDGTNTYIGSAPLAIARTTTNDKIAFIGSAVTNLSETLPAYNIGLYGTASGGTNNFAGYFNLGNVYIDNNLGIGRLAPTYRLDIFGNGGATNLMKVSNDINSTYDSTFVIKSNGFVGIGISAPLHPLHVCGSDDRDNVSSEYSGSYARAAVKGRATGSAGYGIIGSAGTIGAKAGLFNNYAGGTALEVIADNGIAINVKSGDVVVDSTRFHSLSTTLSDNEAYAFPTNLSWKGEIDVDSLGYTLFTAQIRCDANGTPYLEGVSWKRWSSKTYVEVGSTDGYFNIYDAGSGMAIKNSLGYTIKATLRFRAKQ